MTRTEFRFWSKVSFARGGRGCWLWTGCISSEGYGQFASDGRKHKAHRFSYERNVEPIPAGLQIDHVRDRGCTNRHCVNYQDHLEAVTQRENIRRGDTGKHFRDRTHCPAGHPYDASNTQRRPCGRRRCRACAADYTRRYRALAQELGVSL